MGLSQAERDRIAELEKIPCTCVFCKHCNGTGEEVINAMDDIFRRIEPCVFCEGEGIIDECLRCAEISQIYMDHEYDEEA